MSAGGFEGEKDGFHRFHSRVGTVMRGPEMRGSATAPIGSFVQTPAGPFVSPAHAADCARFLAELRQRLVPRQDLPSEASRRQASGR